ncbi:MAG: helix-turn-helix transcriptional regulator [Eubacteriales bacterium]|nr:helix-turn-helix transcriptional regulator [Eubacteriales bacterium]
MEVGKKIKRFRTAFGLSQKELAQRAGMSEPAIRNYELGNRTPSEKQLEKIAGALGVSIYAISNPNLENYDAVLHALFYLEDEYSFIPKEIDGQVYLAVENKNAATRTVSKMLSSWNSEFEKLKSGEINKGEYDMWRYSYPRIKAERLHEEFKKLKNNTEK